MRIVSGKYKRRRFDVPKSFKARPTTDFAKENLFNVISNLIDIEGCEALDLFSGTGSIAFEFLSRECKEVVSIEKDPVHYAFIKKVKAELGDNNLITIRADVFNYIQTCNRQFHIIFADPPYALKNLADIPPLIFQHELIKEGGILVMEHPKEYDFSVLPCFSQRRVYGAVNFSIFIKSNQRAG